MANLSPAAAALLRLRLAGEWVAVTDENLPLYRELAGAGLVEPLSTFLRGKEGNFRPTEAAYAVNGLSGQPPVPSEAHSPHA
jgi:hypothetical protein